MTDKQKVLNLLDLIKEYATLGPEWPGSLHIRARANLIKHKAAKVMAECDGDHEPAKDTCADGLMYNCKYHKERLEGRFTLEDYAREDYTGLDGYDEDMTDEEFLELMKQEYMTGCDSWLGIQYVVDDQKEYQAVILTATYGGPNIYIDTRFNVIQGYWGGERVMLPFDDVIGIKEAFAEYYACT